MRLINADSLLRHAIDLYDAKGHPRRAVDIGRIMNAKTTDAVEVVRCKDCDFAEGRDGGLFYCYGHGDVNGANDFCSYGERRQDGEEQTGTELARG